MRWSRSRTADAPATVAVANHPASGLQHYRPHFGNIPVELRPRAVLWCPQIQTSDGEDL